MDRAGGARRCELDQAEIFAGGAVNIEPPSDPLVKRLRAIDIRNGDDDDLELHVNSRDARVSCCVVTMDFIGAHQYLPCSAGIAVTWSLLTSDTVYDASLSVGAA
jgi:hypothetical protein